MGQRRRSRPDDFAGTLRQAIADSGLTYSAIARGIGVSIACISRFARGEVNLQLEPAGRLAALLGYGLRKIETKRKDKAE